MTVKLHLPHYFTNTIRRQIGELYASTAIADIGIAIVMLFEPIYLYTVLGFTIPQVLWFMAAVYVLYVLTLPAGAWIASRFGYKHTIIVSIPLYIIYWILLFEAQHSFSLIYFAPLAFALQKSLFWPAYHAILSRFAQERQRGREFSAMHAIINIAFVVGPIVGGLLSDQFGLRITFIIAAAIFLLSAVPLLLQQGVFIPKLYQFKDTLWLYWQFPKKAIGYMGFGEELLVLTIWPIFMYTVIRGYGGTGFAATIATLISTIVALYIGKYIDGHSKALLLKLGAVWTAVVWGLRFIAVNFWTVLVIDTLSRVSKEFVFIPLSTITYERAEKDHILPYVVFFEQSLAIGKLLACIAGIILFTMTGSFSMLFLLGGIFSLLYIFV